MVIEVTSRSYSRGLSAIKSNIVRRIILFYPGILQPSFRLAPDVFERLQRLCAFLAKPLVQPSHIGLRVKRLLRHQISIQYNPSFSLARGSNQTIGIL